MNIAFLYPLLINPQSGGVERVTFTLAKYFESKGHNIFFLALKKDNSYKDERQFFLPDSDLFISKKNIVFFKSFLSTKSIDIIINKGGNNPGITKLSYYAKKQGVSLISVVHNSILATIRNFSLVNKTKFERLGLGFILPITNIKIIKFFLFFLFKLKYKEHYKSLCIESDYVFLLSDKYKEELLFFIDDKLIKNVIGIPNPVSFDEVIIKKKYKELLYVGRIDTSQKQINILLDIWNMLYKQFPEWKLNIVGDGDELQLVKNYSAQLKLKNIFFYGFKDPKPFYETASIFTMTSSYEGLPMTLIESLHYGVVPIAFNSFLGATDIIDNNINGYLISPFNIHQYADTLSDLMLSKDKLDKLSISARQKIKEFNLETIGNKWHKILNSLVSSK